tara:strand:+ start:731 stop:1333 length:603 start_codon:yes stop_codon:yes gene_type:complete
MKLKLPENIEDITLDQYQKYTVLVGREDLDEISFNKRLISIFTDLKFRDIEKVAYKDYEFIVAQITLALTQEAEFKSTFKINGVEFGFIPNLNDISTGEYVDLSTHGTTIENMHKVMAVLFRPIKSKDFFGNYEIEPYTGTKRYAELMKYTPLSIVNGALVFFYNLSKELRIATQKSTIAVQAKVNELQAISKNGDGTQQ